MIKIEKTDVYGWQTAIRGMRNPKNSWDKSDSRYGNIGYEIGEQDLKLMKTLANAGADHGKYLRMIIVTADITAPLYWWKEYDTYKVGTVANSCSTMHKLISKPFEKEDFSFEKLDDVIDDDWIKERLEEFNEIRDAYINYDRLLADGELRKPIEKKDIWYALIQMLPSSYNQKRTIQLNYAVLRNMYRSRQNHKLDEWREFCKWVKKLPYSRLITG